MGVSAQISANRDGISPSPTAPSITDGERESAIAKDQFAEAKRQFSAGQPEVARIHFTAGVTAFTNATEDARPALKQSIEELAPSITPLLKHYITSEMASIPALDWHMTESQRRTIHALYTTAKESGSDPYPIVRDAISPAVNGLISDAQKLAGATITFRNEFDQAADSARGIATLTESPTVAEELQRNEHLMIVPRQIPSSTAEPPLNQALRQATAAQSHDQQLQTRDSLTHLTREKLEEMREYATLASHYRAQFVQTVNEVTKRACQIGIDLGPEIRKLEQAFPIKPEASANDLQISESQKNCLVYPRLQADN